MLYRMLSNPMYGGAYAYGKTERTLHYEHGEPRASSRRKPRAQWLALIPNAHEGYVSWDEFERIQHAMTENLRGSGHAGAATNGAGVVGRALALSALRPEADGLVHWPRSQCAPVCVLIEARWTTANRAASRLAACR